MMNSNAISKNKGLVSVVGFILFIGIVGIAFSTVLGVARAQGRPDTINNPLGSVTTAEQAQETADGVAAGWGEPNPGVVRVTKGPSSIWLESLAARGDYVDAPVTGDIWTVEMTGTFTPRRGRVNFDHRPTFSRMQVVIDAATGLIVDVSSENLDSSSS